MVFTGNHVVLEPLNPTKHFTLLYKHFSNTPHLWDYLPISKPNSPEEFLSQCIAWDKDSDMMWFSISKNAAPEDYIGLIGLMSIVPHHRSIEFGMMYSKELQRSTAGTESFYLLMKYCFELGYLRLEWKCHSMNEHSKAAAIRYGFKYEGTFRKHMVVGDRSRDSDFYSIIDEEWPAIRKEMERWLQSSNFDPEGRQLTRLVHAPKP